MNTQYVWAKGRLKHLISPNYPPDLKRGYLYTACGLRILKTDKLVITEEKPEAGRFCYNCSQSKQNKNADLNK